MRKVVRYALLASAAAGVTFGAHHYFTGMHHEDLAIFTHNKQIVHFNVEVAATSDEGKKGLQGRKALPAGTGMLFPIPHGEIVWMWMKDTQIPIDMIFIGLDRRITKIAQHNKPFDETPVRSDGAVSAILEISDGLAQADEINVGDKVDWPE